LSKGGSRNRVFADTFAFQERTSSMAACVTLPHGAPRIALTLVGSGELLMRLEKRLHCAAAGLGLALEVDIRKNAEALGIPFAQTPAVLMEGQVVLNGLPRTEEIEDWMRHTFHTEKQDDEPRS
jgi:hypothetical protein